MSFGYIYKTTNIISKKIYIGKKEQNNFDENYLGSGKLIKSSINKYGRENFLVEIIEWCESLEHLNTREIFWVKQFNSTKRDIGYNIAFGGNGGDIFTNNPDKEKIKKKISISLKQTECSTRFKKGETSYNKGIPFSEEVKEKQSNSAKNRKIHGHTGFKHSESAKAKMSIAKIGKSPINKGVPCSEETKQKIREKRANQVITEEAKQKLSKALNGRRFFNNGVMQVMTFECPEGYIAGRLKKETRRPSRQNTTKINHNTLM